MHLPHPSLWAPGLRDRPLITRIHLNQRSRDIGTIIGFEIRRTWTLLSSCVTLNNESIYSLMGVEGSLPCIHPANVYCVPTMCQA